MALQNATQERQNATQERHIRTPGVLAWHSGTPGTRGEPGDAKDTWTVCQNGGATQTTHGPWDTLHVSGWMKGQPLPKDVCG